MKKPLQDSRKEIAVRRHSIVDFAFDGGGEQPNPLEFWYYCEPSDRISFFVDSANDLGGDALDWIKRIERYGITESLLKELEDTLKDVEIRGRIIFDRKDLGMKIANSPVGDITMSDKMFAAFEISLYITEGMLGGLGRCELPECRRYFIRNAKAKWCSDNCGSKHRIRKKRKLDRERQML